MTPNRRAIWTLAATLWAGIVSAAEPALTVTVEKAAVRAQPSFLAPSVGSLRYGQNVNEVGRRKSWVHVKSGALAVDGWVKRGEVTVQQTNLIAGGGSAASEVTSDELYLAGKGFDEAIEATYRRSNTRLEAGYRALESIDSKTSFAVTPEQSRVFLVDGSLTPEETP